MFVLVASCSWIFVAWKWGDWKHWRKYHPTILYWIICDLMNTLFTQDYRLWQYTNKGLPGIVDVLVQMLVIYPCAMLIYQYRFPIGLLRQVGYILAWTTWWSIVEVYLVLRGRFVYGHGWNIWWSIIFNVVAFIMLRIHYFRPLLAYLLSVPFTVFLLWYFHVPFIKL